MRETWSFQLLHFMATCRSACMKLISWENLTGNKLLIEFLIQLSSQLYLKVVYWFTRARGMIMNESRTRKMLASSEIMKIYYMNFIAHSRWWYDACGGMEDMRLTVWSSLLCSHAVEEDIRESWEMLHRMLETMKVFLWTHKINCATLITLFLQATQSSHQFASSSTWIRPVWQNPAQSDR